MVAVLPTDAHLQAQFQAGPSMPPDPDVLLLDAQTLKDLEIFESETGGPSLFDFCNLAQTEGGAKVLRRRMQLPWSNGGRIRATQDSVAFILANRQVFSMLPSAYTTNRTAYYTHEILPIVSHENRLEFTLGAYSLWVNHVRYYSSIVRGVQTTCGLIHTLRQLVAQAGLMTPRGELAPLLEEMQVLLTRPRLSVITDQTLVTGVWRILRLDQVFRIHEKVALARLLQLVFEIDALVAMADVTRTNDFVLPTIESGALGVQAEGLVHPFVDKAVANAVELDQACRVLFLTGPNMAGKTTYLRAFATALYLAHLGMGVPARSLSFAPAQRLFSSISLSDDLRNGVSYFRAEALRVKAVAEAVADGYRVVAIMDEPFKGTNVKDAFDASLAILERFSAQVDCLFMFSSHLIELSEKLSDTGQIDCRYFEADETEGRLRFSYLLQAGVSSQRLGMRVLREEGVFELLDKRFAENPSGA
ncbi:MAG: DNA mismatch repair protein MutS [Candidatus Azotimanducaceae bacterium]|jgi:DNA mismatch repair protein MutS